VAAFDFFGSPDDNIKLMKIVLDNSQLQVIPDIPYKEPMIYMTNSVDNFIEREILNKRIFYLWQKEFYPIFPLQFHHHHKEGKDWYNFYRSPSLVFSTSNFVINEEGDWLRGVSSYLSHTTELYDKENHAVIPIPQKVKEEYKRIVKLMKSNMKKLKNKSIWFGEEAYEMFMKGDLEIYYGHLGKWITYMDVT
jgi:hypothetical protein